MPTQRPRSPSLLPLCVSSLALLLLLLPGRAEGQDLAPRFAAEVTAPNATSTTTPNVITPDVITERLAEHEFTRLILTVRVPDPTPDSTSAANAGVGPSRIQRLASPWKVVMLESP